MQLRQLFGRERDPVGVEGPHETAELGQAGEAVLGTLEHGRVVPHGLRELQEDGAAARDRRGEVGLDQRRAGGRVRAARAGRGVAEARHAGRQERRPEGDEQDDARRERGARPPRGDHPDAVPQARPLVGPRRRARRPEHRPAEDREQGGKEREAGQQHQGDADRERRPEALVERELAEARLAGGDDGQGREHDRFADPAHGSDHRLVRRQAAPELLAHAEHEEHAVVGPGAEDEHDQQKLGDRRDLHADLRRLRDDRPRQHEHEERRHEGHDRGEHRSERQQEQDDDDEDNPRNAGQELEAC